MTGAIEGRVGVEWELELLSFVDLASQLPIPTRGFSLRESGVDPVVIDIGLPPLADLAGLDAEGPSDGVEHRIDDVPQVGPERIVEIGRPPDGPLAEAAEEPALDLLLLRHGRLRLAPQRLLGGDVPLARPHEARELVLEAVLDDAERQRLGPA